MRRAITASVNKSRKVVMGTFVRWFYDFSCDFHFSNCGDNLEVLE